MNIILSHSGKQHSYHVANALEKLGYLAQFYTSGYIVSSHIQKWAKNNPSNSLNKRFHPELNTEKVKPSWSYEIKELLLHRIYGAGDYVQRAVFKRDVSFDRNLSQRLMKLQFNSFWGFQGSCLHSLQVANQLGRVSICELATAHVTAANHILKEEQQLHPEWADSIDNIAFPPSYEKRLEEEPQVAQRIIAASEFTRQSLLEAGIEASKIFKLPLGFDHTIIPFQESTIATYKNRPLKLLYAGRVTQRKGIKYLLEALKQIGNTRDIHLDIIGYTHGSGNALKQYREYYRQHSAVSQHELFQKYSAYDALVLPSVFEGFGLVIIEAMAAGLPVITTPNTMGPDIIEDDKNGYIVPIRNTESLQKAILKLANKSDHDLMQMKMNARQSALGFTWGEYQKKLSLLLPELLKI